MVTLAVLALWLPITFHCALESIPGLEFLACPADPSRSGKPGSDCGDSGCCAAEKSQYKTEQHRLKIPPPDFLPVLSTPLLTAANTLPDEPGLDLPTAAPPGLPKCWQFLVRAAAPPRAPSFAS